MAKKTSAAPAAGAAPSQGTVHLAAHPRARRHIALAKSYGGLLGFGLTLMLSTQAGVGGFESGVRALVVGMACYVLAWAGAVAVWRQLAIGEVHAARARAAMEAEILATAADDAVREHAAKATA